MRKIYLLLVLLVQLFLVENSYSQYCGLATTNVAITPTTTAQLSSSYSTGRRAFNFVATAGCTYYFETCGLSNADTYLRLYSTGTGGSVLAAGDDNCGSQSAITWTCTTSGTYSILMTNWSCAVLNAATRLSYRINSCPAPCASNNVNLSITAGAYPGEVSWTLVNPSGATVASGGAPYNQNLCLPTGCYTFNMNDSWNDGWNGANYTFTLGGSSIGTGTLASGGSGSAQIGIGTSCAPPAAPANDACANATSLPCGTSSLAGTTVNSVSETAPGGGGLASNFGVWYTFTGNGGQTTISSTGTGGFDHEITILSGSCGALTLLSSQDGFGANGTETYTFNTVNGTVYYVYVAHWLSSGTSANVGTFTISRTCLAPCTPPSNDLCANAPILDLGANNNQTHLGTGACSTPNLGTYKDVWVAFTVPCGGMNVAIDFCGSTPVHNNAYTNIFPNCSLNTWTGASNWNFTSCAGGNIKLFWNNVPAGTYYYPILIDPAWETNYVLNISGTPLYTPAVAPTSISGTTAVCAGQSTTLTLQGGSAGTNGVAQWFAGSCGSTVIGTGNSITVSPTANTTYFVRYAGSCNTTTCASTSVTVNALPTWGNLQWPPSGAICAGGTYDIYGQVYENGVTNANFHAPGAGIVAQFGYSTSNSNPNTWSTWSTATYNVGVGNNDEFKGTFSGLSAGTYYYAFRYALNNGTCYVYGGYNVSGGGFWNGTTNVSGVLTVNAIPSISGTANVCMGSSTALTGSGTAASSNAWSSTNTGVGTINTTTTTGTLSPVAVGTTNVTYTDNNGCVSAATTVTVNALPTVTATASAASLCSGSNLTLTGGGASTYAWNNGVSNGVAFTPNATQTYTVTGTNANGCVNTASTSVTVNALPTANAGLDIIDPSTCGKNTVNVGGNALAAGQSGQWSVLSATNNGGNQGLFSLAGTAANDQFTGAYGGTYVLQWALTSGGCTGTDQMTVTFNQPSDATISAMVGSGDLLWCGLTNTDWSTSTNWYQKQVAGHYIRMSGAVQPGIGNEVFTVSTANGGMCVGNSTPSLSVNSNAEDVYVGAGVVLNLSNDSINIAQNLINQGTIAASTGTVNFTGNNNSTVSGSGTTQLFNMRVNKSAGATLTLQQPVLVTNVLTMNQGNVFTTSANLLTLGSSSAAPGSLSYNSGTIVGPFKRYFANAASAGTAGLFPVGTAVFNRYADFSFGSGPGVDQYLTVEYMTGAPLQGGVPLYNGLPLTALGSLIQNYSADGYWSVIPTNNNYAAPITSVNYGVTLFANNLTGMQSPQVCRIIKSAGSNTTGQHHVAWQACGTHTAINGAANPQAFLITSTATQGFSWFNIGTPNSQALPVELLSFNGDCNEGQVNISWQTATEHNSDYFEVEKSRDGMNWQVLTTVNAAGNSTQLLNYEATDAHAMEGNNYYRLTQVDIDGTTKTYDVINVSCSGAAKGYFSAYPNPSTGSFQVILNDKNLVGSGNLSVKDTKGAELLNRTIEVKPGINMFSVTDLNLAPGVYYIQIVNGERATEVLKEVIR